ncbi:MAG: hypothetical protein QM796_09385 [Chthoniobacteraceae bacterium]
MSDHSSHGSADSHAHSAEELNHHVQFNTKIFIVLLSLTGFTILCQFVHLGPKATAWAQLLLLLTKCAFVAGFGTFLLHRSKMLTNIFIFTAFFALMLIALTVWGSLWGSPIPGTIPTK